MASEAVEPGLPFLEGVVSAADTDDPVVLPVLEGLGVDPGEHRVAVRDVPELVHRGRIEVGRPGDVGVHSAADGLAVEVVGPQGLADRERTLAGGVDHVASADPLLVAGRITHRDGDPSAIHLEPDVLAFVAVGGTLLDGSPARPCVEHLAHPAEGGEPGGEGAAVRVVDLGALDLVVAQHRRRDRLVDDLPEVGELDLRTRLVPRGLLPLDEHHVQPAHRRELGGGRSVAPPPTMKRSTCGISSRA
jgi:hypothetical protein